MRRRQFLSATALASLAGFSRADAAPPTPLAADRAEGGSNADGFEIDDYFAQSGNLSQAEQAAIADYEAYLDVRQRGGAAIQPRGGRPRWSPTYRMLHWPAEAGETGVALSGPLSVDAAMPPDRAYRLNAQILDFHTSRARWGRGARGTLTVEIRGRQNGEPLTWLFAEQFDCFGDATSLGNSYVAERNDLPEPVIIDEPIVDIRLQLLRHRKAPGLLRKILNLASFVATGGATGVLTASLPSIRVPQLVQEGVALSQALFGGMSEERPLWLSGFNSFALAEGGSRFRLAPGYWIVVDENVGYDLSQVTLEEQAGRMRLMQEGEPVDATYLVLWVELESGSTRRGQGGIIPKGG